MREWAERFGISRPHLIALLEGQRMPSPAVARRIAAGTDGAVPVETWPNIAAMIRELNGGAA